MQSSFTQNNEIQVSTQLVLVMPEISIQICLKRTRVNAAARKCFCHDLDVDFHTSRVQCAKNTSFHLFSFTLILCQFLAIQTRLLNCGLHLQHSRSAIRAWFMFLVCRPKKQQQQKTKQQNKIKQNRKKFYGISSLRNFQMLGKH